jgi:hypothetical protein
MNRLPASRTFLLLVMTLFPAANCVADFVVRELGKENNEPRRYFVPYGFSSEAMGLVAGVAGGISGLPQAQNSLFTTALVSSEGAAAVYAFFNDYQFSRVPRLFLDAAVGLGDFPQQRTYLDTSPPVNKPPAGSNDSSADDFFRSDGFSNWIELDFKYVLDIGHGRYTPINTYTLSNGLLVGGASGGDVFNPFKSGRSYVQAKLFHQDRDFDAADPSTVLETSGIGLSFKYDNTDFQVNPATGNVFEIGIKHDPGSYDSESWTVAELEFSQYFKLTPGANVEQSVIAFDFWTAHTFSDDDPPFYMRPKLGGLYRLRAYPIERFHDNSAMVVVSGIRRVRSRRAAMGFEGTAQIHEERLRLEHACHGSPGYCPPGPGLVNRRYRGLAYVWAPVLGSGRFAVRTVSPGGTDWVICRTNV